MTDTQTASDPNDILQLAISEQIAVITLNRPAARNALSLTMRDSIVTTLNSLSQDCDVRVIILTGAGKAFCAGLDLKELQSIGHPMKPTAVGMESPVVKAFRDCPKPIIGAINGYAITGGFELALACDFLYAAESAQFADTHARVGLVPGWGLSQKLPRLIGINRAREMSFSGNFISARDAESWGLVNRVFPDSELMDQAMKIAAQIAETRPDTLDRIRQMMNSGWEMTLGDGLRMEGENAGQHNSQTGMGEMGERLSELKERSKG